MGAFVVLSSLFFINKTFNLVTPKLNTIFLFTGGYTLVSSIFQYIMIKRDEALQKPAAEAVAEAVAAVA